MRLTVVIYRVAVADYLPNRLPEQAHQKHTLVGYDTYTIPAINGATTCAITCAFGGPGRIRTGVLNTSSLKELQLFFYLFEHLRSV